MVATAAMVATEAMEAASATQSQVTAATGEMQQRQRLVVVTHKVSAALAEARQMEARLLAVALVLVTHRLLV
jgi:hypothetical protein